MCFLPERPHTGQFYSIGTLSNWVLGNMANNLAVAPDRFSNPCLTPAGARTVSPSPRSLAGNPDSPQAVVFLTSIIDEIVGVATYYADYHAISHWNTSALCSAKPGQWLSGQTSSVTTWSPRIASRLPSMMTMASSLSGWMWVVTRPPGPISRWLMYNDRAPWVASTRTARSTVVAEDRAAGWVHWFGSVRRIQAIICSRREIR